MSSKRDLLLEIGCEELPASFVDAAVRALPELAKRKLEALRLGYASARALGSPRRLALVIEGLDAEQADLSEEVLGPPVRAAFKDGKATRAAEAFAEKLGLGVEALRRVDTPKGEYLAGTREEKGKSAIALMAEALPALIAEIPFRKSMRWADLDFAFGRPIQWIVALFGSETVPFELAGITSGRATLGHRFLAPEGREHRDAPLCIELASAADYVPALRAAHVYVDPEERRAALAKALDAAAKQAGGALIEDEFLMGENASLVEEPHVIVGRFEESFLELPEQVILEVAKGHQRYFGVRLPNGKLFPGYLAVVNTALEPALIQKGNDRVMRARLADARFFYSTDLAQPLVARREKLAGVVFQKKLGTVLEKAERIEKLAGALGQLLGLDASTIAAATEGAHLAKCDLVSLMVGEFPELQGDMGRSYALAQGVRAEVAEVISEHYRPKGASDATAPSDAAALVAIADRLDTLVGCFGIGLVPSGTADPFALRRACLGILRTLLDRGFDQPLSAMIALAHQGYAAGVLEASEAELVAKVGEFAAERLRGLLSDPYPADAVRACLAVGSDRPIDVRARAEALASLDDATRAQVGEVFKRATNIAKEAPAGAPGAPPADAHASELALFEAFTRFDAHAAKAAERGAFAELLAEVAGIAPVMQRYFTDVFVMTDDLAVRETRLRLMRAISERVSSVARLELLAQ